MLDASTAFRVAPDWAYGFPELTPDQADKIRAARKVSNPGCYPTGGIALLRPLVDAGLLPADYPVTINAVSGYSGGGKSMIASFEDGSAPSFELYGLGFEHKHLPETQLYSKLTRRPIFVPSVGNYRQGMLVSVPLHLDTLTGKPGGADLHAALAKRYAGSKYVSVMPLENAATKGGRIEPEALNETNKLELYVFASEKHRQAVLVARLDNLGKGASGAAVQNMRLMLGLADKQKERAMSPKKKIGILGASGYTGADAVRLLARHPNAEITALTANTHAGKAMGEVFPHFFMLDLPKLVEWEKVDWSQLDAVFCGLPHGTTQEIIAAVLKANPGIKILDMSADFRLRDKDTYAQWYGHEHRALELQGEAVYGLTEFTGRRSPPRGWSPVPAAIRPRCCSRWCRWRRQN